MYKSRISWVALAGGLLAVAAFGGACSSGGGGHTTPSPTPLSITVDTFKDKSGSSTVDPGECLGFTVHEAHSQFTNAVTMQFVTAGGQDVFIKPFGDINSTSAALYPALVISSNGSSFTFGSSGTLTNGDYPCEGLPFLPAGSYSVRVDLGTRNATATNALTWGAPHGAAATLGTGATITPVAGNLPKANDFNYHPFTAGSGF